MKQQNLDLYAWQPTSEAAIADDGGDLAVSQSRVVEQPEEVHVVEDNHRMLNDFLKDLDLQVWGAAM